MTNEQKKIRAVSPSNLKQAIQFQASITCCILRACGQEEYGVSRTPCYPFKPVEKNCNEEPRNEMSHAKQYLSNTGEKGGSGYLLGSIEEGDPGSLPWEGPELRPGSSLQLSTQRR